MSRIKKSAAIWMATVVLSSGIAGTVPAYAGQAPTTLSLMTWDGSDPIVKGIFDAAVKQFEKKHPNVTVQIENVTYNNYFTKLQTELAAGAPPDIIELGESDFKRYWDKGTLTNLMPYANSKKDGLNVKDIYPSILKIAMQGKDLPVIPVGPTTFSILYNKTLFKQAHIPFPKNNWTWQQFAADAKKLTKTSGGRTTQWGALMPAGSDTIEPLIIGKGGRIISPNGKKTLGYLNSHKSESIFKWYVDLAKAVGPSPAEQKAMNGIDLFGTGKVAMTYTGPWSIQTYEQNKMDFGVVELPNWPGKRKQNFMYTAGYGISSKSKNAELAWEFLSETVNPKTAIGKMWVTHGLPAFKSLANSKEYKDPNWQPYVKQLPYIADSAYFQNANFRAAQSEYLNPAITKMFSQNVNIGELLKTTAAQIDQYFQQQGS